jgi:hypothetical protein
MNVAVGSNMTSGEMYRAKADTMAARARADTTQAGREHYALLCLGYLRLAEQVDRRSQTNSVDETLSPVIDQQISTRRILQRLLEHIDHLRMAWLVPLVSISLLTIDVVFAQQVETSQQRFKRLLDCRFSAGQLVGLTRDQLRDKCGPWNEANGKIGANGKQEQLVYIDYASGPLMYVYIESGKVTKIQTW